MTTPTQQIFNKQINLLTRLAAVVEAQSDIFDELLKANEMVLKDYTKHITFLKELADAQSSSQDDNGSSG